MAPRIDPALPLVWRTPTDVQLGATTARVVLRAAGDLEIGLIAALRHGASIETLRIIGAGLGGAIDDVERVLAMLEPAFEERQVAEPRARSRAGSPAGSPSGPASARAGSPEPRVVVVDADGVLAEHLIADLTALGYHATTPRAVDDGGPHDDEDAAADRPALAIVAATWAIPPARHLPWLRRDVPHLAVVFDDTGARVGPLVEPGVGPCLRCLDLRHRDADPAWPVIAAQLAGRPAPTATTRASIEAATLAVALVDDRLAHGSTAMADASLTLSRERPAGSPRRLRHAPHPECGCRSPGGTATAPVHLDVRRRREAGSASAGAVPA